MPPVNTFAGQLASGQRNWRTVLDSEKSGKTRDNYTTHIKDFLTKRGNHIVYHQEDIDEYFAPSNKNRDEGESTKRTRLYAIKFLLEQCLDLKLKFKGVRLKGKKHINPHAPFTSK